MKKTLLVLALALPLLAQPTPAIQQRIDSLVAAFNGSPETWETYAQSTFTPEALGRSDAAKRRRTHAQLRTDFGQLAVTGADRASDSRLVLDVRGSTGERGAIMLDIEPTPPHRITGIGFRIGGGQEGPPAPPAPVKGSMTAEELAKALDPYMAKLVAEGRFSGSLLVAREGKAIYERAFGFANRSDEVPNTLRTRHNLGSINKHFTKTAIAQLAAAGKLTLTDTLGKHLPEHANVDARAATIEQLLEHTAGLGDFFGPDFRNADKGRFRSNSDFYAFVAPRPLTFAPGTRRQYCNACYITLGEVVTRVSGIPYERYVEQNVLRPAGMMETGFFQTDQVVPRLAHGYLETRDGVRSNLYMKGAGASAAGGAFATASDLLALDNALRDGKLMDAKWTSWFFKVDPPGGRITASSSYAGGSGGINAGVSGNGHWTVVAMANISPPAAEALAEEIHRALTAQ